MNKITWVLLLSWLLTSCAKSTEDGKALPETVGIALANRDTTVSPSEDFYRYVNGGWISKTTIPSDRGLWNAFLELREHNNKILRTILERSENHKEYLEGTDQRKAVDFYQVGMDSLSAEKAGMMPLKSLLDKINTIANKADLQNYLIEDDKMNGDAFFKFSVSPDMKNSQRMAAYLGSGGIGLPERDYYFKTDIKSKETLARYEQHLARMLILLGWDEAKARKSAGRVLSIEKELASATFTKEDRRDALKQYNRFSVSDLSNLIPSINWKAYFLTMGVKVDSVIVTQPVFLKGYEKVVNLFSLEDVKHYLRWTLVRKAAPFLNYASVRESFEFNSKYLHGTEQLPRRWKRVLETSDQYLGEAIGKLYVAETFPPEAKKKAMEMVENIRFAFADRIKQLEWMSDSTKKKALKKLSAVTVKIGFPDKWKNYNGLIVDHIPDRGSYYGNILNALRYQVKEQINRLSLPVDKTVWDMTPQTVNAYYNAQFNEIVFPAGILQPPFYDYRADEAVNYGAIGAGIGHEISHGFDDQGSRFDADGNLKNWWTVKDLNKFKEKGKVLVEQFNRYQPLPELYVQGQFTLGENIGDLAGLNAAHDGLLRFFREFNQKPGLINGLSPEQRFFMSWATIWRTKYREEALRTQVLTNEHAPGMYRANGPVSNMPAFYKAFGIKAGDKMFRDEKDRVVIW